MVMQRGNEERPHQCSEAPKRLWKGVLDYLGDGVAISHRSPRPRPGNRRYHTDSALCLLRGWLLVDGTANRPRTIASYRTYPPGSCLLFLLCSPRTQYFSCSTRIQHLEPTLTARGPSPAPSPDHHPSSPGAVLCRSHTYAFTIPMHTFSFSTLGTSVFVYFGDLFSFLPCVLPMHYCSRCPFV
jgi:hypothetical protein